MRISDWSSDVCSSDLTSPGWPPPACSRCASRSTTAACTAGVTTPSGSLAWPRWHPRDERRCHVFGMGVVFIVNRKYPLHLRFSVSYPPHHGATTSCLGFSWRSPLHFLHPLRTKSFALHPSGDRKRVV